MKVLVIGGAGYIGRPLVRLLRERVDTVAIGHSGGDVDAHLDMRHGADVYRLLLQSRPDVVVVTAYLLDRASRSDPLRAVETNVLGLTNIFQVAADLGVPRVVFASSGSVHGRSEDFAHGPLDESGECRPTTLYGKMKLFNEWMAEHYNETTSTEIVSYRVSGPAGWTKPHDRQGGEMPYDTIVGAAKTQRQLVLPWSANTRLRFIHVADAAESFLPLILADTVKHRTYNSPGFTVSVHDIAEAARSIAGLECEFADPGRPVKFVWWDAARYEDEFNFRPRPMAWWMHEEIGGLMAQASK